MKWGRKMGAILDRATNLGGILSTFVIVFIGAVVSINVAMRYLLNYSIEWYVEISQYCILGVTFLSSAWLLKEGGHVSIDLVLGRLKPRAKSLVNTITSSVGAILCLVVTWYGLAITWDYFQRGIFRLGSVAEVPLYLVLWVMPVGAFLLFYQFVVRAYTHLRNWGTSASKNEGCRNKPPAVP